MKKRPERRCLGPCVASQFARRAASRSRVSSSTSGVGALVEESEAVFITEPMVGDVERTPVYLEKQLEATVETAANVPLGDFVATRCDTGTNARDGEIRRWERDEVDHGPEPQLGPSTKPGKVRFR